MDLTKRPRRLRRSEAMRSLVRETSVRVDDLIYPMFVTEGEKTREPIDPMPGQYRFTVDELVAECQELWDLGIPAVNLFGYSTEKDDMATKSYDPEGLIQRAVRGIKAQVPELCVQTDIALDPYTNHGHDGLVVDDEIINDETVEVLCKMALSHAEAGVDVVAPSDMMDGRVGGIRQALDVEGHTNVGILAYSAKYASCFYGPFRGALESAPKKGDKKTYQMDPANGREALVEIAFDIEGRFDLPANNRAPEIWRIAIDRVDDHICNPLFYVIPRTAIRQMSLKVLAKQTGNMATGRCQAIILRRRHLHRDHWPRRPAVQFRV